MIRRTIAEIKGSDWCNGQIGLMILSALILVAANLPLKAANWPQWRGPYGNGITEGGDLPVEWSTKQNIVWKTKLPSWSGSSPIVWGDRVFVISPSEDQKKETDTGAGDRDQLKGAQRGERSRGRNRFRAAISGPGGPSILIFCIARQDGAVLWQREVDSGNELRLKHNSSSPSPVTDGRHVWVTTGNGVVMALDMWGNELWRFDLQKAFGPFGLGFGYASSPLLFEDKLIYQVLHGRRTDDPSYIVALDTLTGTQLWRRERPTDAIDESPDAYTTPTLLIHAGKSQIVILGGDYVTGHDPDSGREVWRSGGLNPRKARNYRIVPSPVAIDGMIYAPTRKTPLLALRAGGHDDITDSHAAWKWDGDGAPDVPTPVCDGKYFYMVDDRGLVTCLDAKTGTVIWGPQDTGIGSVSASPVLADGKLYIVSESAETAVIRAGPDFQLLGTNRLNGAYTLSSPAIAGKHLFIRTGQFLYCISQAAAN